MARRCNGDGASFGDLHYLYIGNLQPLPAGATEHAIALFGLLGWLFIPWAWWIERTCRTVRI